MKLQIDRVSVNDITYDEFVQDYLLPEKLVVLTGVDLSSFASFTPEAIKERFLKEDMRRPGWFDVELSEARDVVIPDIVSRVMERPDMSTRDSPMRIFMQPRGHRTLPHYDGNSLHGLNLQVAGRKRWLLTSPRTPLPLMPFMFVAMVKEGFTYPTDKYDVYDFETEPGDLLFLARYTCHEVHSLDDVNLNFNWIFTPTSPNESTPLGRREVEIVKLRKTVPIVNSVFFPDDFSQYGGRGGDLIDRYSSHVGRLRTAKRLVKEVARFSLLPLYAMSLRRQAKEFDSNNFNV